MSFLRHRQIYQSDAVSGFNRKQGLQPCLRNHRLDEFAASYSLAGCSPAEPASASPAGSIFNRPAQLVNRHLRRVAAFSTGIMRHFQPELTVEAQPRSGLIVLASNDSPIRTLRVTHLRRVWAIFATFSSSFVSLIIHKI